MSVREKILSDLSEIESPNKLNKIYDFIQQFNVTQENRTTVLDLKGSLSDDDAQEMMTIVKNEFSQIEGDWE